MTATVLVVDDEPDLRLTVRMALSIAGHRVVESGSGEEGIAAVVAARPDAIIVDIALPGISGWEMIERLRSSNETVDIPVIILSAHVSQGNADRAASLHAAYLAKPFSVAELQQAVGSALSRNG